MTYYISSRDPTEASLQNVSVRQYHYAKYLFFFPVSLDGPLRDCIQNSSPVTRCECCSQAKGICEILLSGVFQQLKSRKQ